jgi:uncharacterized protein
MLTTVLGSSRPEEDELMVQRPPLPPFDEESARQKVRAAEDAWNTRPEAERGQSLPVR